MAFADAMSSHIVRVNFEFSGQAIDVLVQPPLAAEDVRHAALSASGNNTDTTDFVLYQDVLAPLKAGDLIDPGFPVSAVKRFKTDCGRPALAPCTNHGTCIYHIRFNEIRRKLIGNAQRRKGLEHSLQDALHIDTLAGWQEYDEHASKWKDRILTLAQGQLALQQGRKPIATDE